MDEIRLPGGNAGGAVKVGDTVRRTAGVWTPAVHELLTHLEKLEFPGVPRVIGFDRDGREQLSFVPGETIGDRIPWPAWVYSDSALSEVGGWLRRYHATVAEFVPSAAAVWRLAPRAWRPGDIIGHNDAAPYNAVWTPSNSSTAAGAGSSLVGFVDWDFARPCSPLWDLASTALAWTPLYTEEMVKRDGFTRFDDRPRRLRLLLDAYGYGGSVAGVLAVVIDKLRDMSRIVSTLAAQGDPHFVLMQREGVVELQAQSISDLRRDAYLFD